MKPQCFTVIFMAKFFLSIEGDSYVRHRTKYQKENVREKTRLKKQHSWSNYQTLSKEPANQFPGQKRQLPIQMNNVQHIFEGPSPYANYQNLRDTVNSMDYREPEPRDSYGGSSPENLATSQIAEESQLRATKQNPLIVSSDRLLNTRMTEKSIPKARHVVEDSFSTSEVSPTSFSEGQRPTVPNQDTSIVNIDGPRNIYMDKEFYPVEIIHKVPRPIPVTHTKLVPFPVHRKVYRYYPHPFPQPFSPNPDIYLSFLHLEGRVNPCQHGGIIVQSPGGYACLCRRAYKGKHCEDRDRCYPNPCENIGECTDHGTHFECKCAKGFKGIICNVEDKCFKHPCKNGGTCMQLPSGAICTCASGFKGKFCQDVDYCHPNPCRNGGTCSEINQDASCTCTSSFKGPRCQVPKTCAPNLCRNGGICQEDKPSSPCRCAAGFTGHYCTENVCEPYPCKNGGTCYPSRSDYNIMWSAACKCRETYKGEHCQIANPCAANPSPCMHGICYDTYTSVDQLDLPPSGFICQCYEGYFGTYCRDKKCDHCDTNARCVDEETCACIDGYQGDGHSCKKIPELCVPNPCENGGVCLSDNIAFECKCAQGFRGKTCHDKNPCYINPCKNGGTCIEQRDHFHCICIGEWKGKDCSENLTNLCMSQPCLNGGTCKMSEDSKSWYCLCSNNRFKPPNCACNCPAKAHGLFERNLTCDNPEGLCVCPKGLTRDHDHDVCVEHDEGIHAKPVSLQPTNHGCEPNPCKNGGTCNIVNGSSICICPEGFKLPFCDHEGKAPCLPNPCQNGGRCMTVGESYDCICDQRFTGPTCQVDKCAKCDPDNARCINGKCICKPGYAGTGYQCQPTKEALICIKCHPVNAICVNSNCQCKEGFTGNGYHCSSIQSGGYYSNQEVPWFKRSL